MVQHCLRDPVFSYFGTMLACDRHTDMGHSINHTCIASRDKFVTEYRSFYIAKSSLQP